MRTIRSGLAASVIIAIALPSAAIASPPPDYGFEFVTVGAVNNRGYEGEQFANTWRGRGSVSYEYRMARLEVSTGQWMEFVNAASPLMSEPFNFARPVSWGATSVPFNPGQYQLRDIPSASMVPVIGISWREAAMYCNWLHNDKAISLNAVSAGAYDTSTFRVDPDTGLLLDQTTRSPDARYWIPSLDEWLKAVHFDPDAQDPEFPGEGRWWDYPYGEDDAPIPGLPGKPGAATSAGGVGSLEHPAAFIPIGSYPDAQTPWGLLDASGGANEWTEEWFGNFSRAVQGSAAGSSSLDHDLVWYTHSAGVTLSGGGLRIASAIPAPGASAVLLGGATLLVRRQR